MNIKKLSGSKTILGIALIAAIVTGCIVTDAYIGKSDAAWFGKNELSAPVYNVSHDISVLSQNLRAPKKVDGPENTLDKRDDRLIRELNKYDTDIKCFQECTYDWKTVVDTKLSFFEYGSVCLFNNKGLANPIYYKMSKFRPIESGTMVLTEDSSDTYDERRLASWAKLKHLATGKTFLIVNAHLAAEINRQVVSCEKIKALIDEKACDAYLVCGDFNFAMKDNEQAYNIMMADGGKDMAISAATEGVQKYTGGTFHDYGREANPKRIDFFFGSASLNSKLYTLIKDTYDGFYVADHYGVMNYVSFVR